MKSEYPPILDTLGWGSPLSLHPLGGGCIADAARVDFEGGKRAFVKRKPGADGMFVAEAAGLAELEQAQAIRTPRVLAVADDALVLEWMDLGRPGADFFERFGEGFARLHDVRGPASGWNIDNFIGATPQVNTPLSADWPRSQNSGTGEDWPQFFLERRLRFQVELAATKAGGADLPDLLEQAEGRILGLLGEAIEPPSLLHGDLWGGNYLVDDAGNAVLIDPAVYYGHREADLAMTRLFGGFDERFYVAYHQVLPLQSGHEKRLPVYQLYHLLNHFNLFGQGYLQSCVRILRSLSDQDL